MQGVAGDKDLELIGGDLTIHVGNSAEYSHVDLSVRFGDVSGTQFGDPKGWLGNSVRRILPRDRLEARAMWRYYYVL